jgi:CheY-like chemotaxis protein
MILKNIFLAEDDPDDQYLFMDALKQIDSDINCQIASNGKETITALKKRTVLPDIIFLDLNMPLMNGFECLSKMKNDKKLCEIPIVIFTTSRNPEDAQATHQLGANFFLSKPNDFSELKAKIKRILTLDFSSPVTSEGVLAQYCV